MRVASGTFNELVSVFCEEEILEAEKVVCKFLADLDILKVVVNVRVVDAIGDIFMAFIIVDLKFAERSNVAGLDQADLSDVALISAFVDLVAWDEGCNVIFVKVLASVVTKGIVVI